jgi:hypothetical protein
MRIIVRIPLDPWAVRYFMSCHRESLEPDGKTIRQTAKDLLGKLVTGYMRKTAFEAWYMGVPKESHLRISLPGNYARHGLTEADTMMLRDFLTDLAQREICLRVAMAASMPGVSRALSIREVFKANGITDEEYDQGHFRRYFDRYAADSLGVDFRVFRSEITRTLKEIYGPVIEELISRVQ